MPVVQLTENTQKKGDDYDNNEDNDVIVEKEKEKLSVECLNGFCRSVLRKKKGR